MFAAASEKGVSRYENRCCETGKSVWWNTTTLHSSTQPKVCRNAWSQIPRTNFTTATAFFTSLFYTPKQRNIGRVIQHWVGLQWEHVRLLVDGQSSLHPCTSSSTYPAGGTAAFIVMHVTWMSVLEQVSNFAWLRRVIEIRGCEGQLQLLHLGLLQCVKDDQQTRKRVVQ